MEYYTEYFQVSVSYPSFRIKISTAFWKLDIFPHRVEDFWGGTYSVISTETAFHNPSATYKIYLHVHLCMACVKL
jgi:hypothetical protein